MRSRFRFVIGTVALLGLSTFAVGSTWSVRFDSSTIYGLTIERVPSGGMVTSTYYHASPGALVVGLNDYGDVIWHSLLSVPAGSQGGIAVVRPSANGGYFVSTVVNLRGQQPNAWIAKLDDAGSIVWQRMWAGGGGLSASDIVALADGGCLVLGTLYADGEEKLWVMRVDAGGATAWSETIDSSGIFTGQARELANGDFVVTARTTGPSAEGSGLVVRLRPDGSIVWQRWLNSPNIINLEALATTASGEILVGGSLQSRGQGSGQFQSGALLVRLNAQGTVLGSRLYPGPLEIQGIAATGDGRVALAGYVFDVPGRFHEVKDGFVIVTDATGLPIFASTHGGPGQDGIDAIVESVDGGFLVSGFGAPDPGHGPYLMIEKLDAWGAMGAACDRIAPRVIDVDTCPIVVRPSSAVIAPFAPTPFPLVLTNGFADLAAPDQVCSAP